MDGEEPSEEDTEEMERVARGVVATMLSAKPPTVHVLDDDEIAERIATAACDALDACVGDADDAFEQAKRAVVCEVKLLLTPPSPSVETEPEHGYTCDGRRCLQEALETFQRVLIEHCIDPTSAEVLAIRARTEAVKQLKQVGQQPARFGGE